jgi:hypothetical protein
MRQQPGGRKKKRGDGMAILLTRPFSTKFSEAMWAEIEAEAERLKQTSSDVVRLAIAEYFNRDKKRSNLERLVYEEAKTRAMVARVIDPEGTLITDELLEWAGKDAEMYLEKGKAPKTEEKKEAA